jgi:hypothetical protein
MCRLLMSGVQNDQCRWLCVGRKELRPDGRLLNGLCYDSVGISLYVASNDRITHELRIAKCFEGNTYGIVKTVFQCVLGDAEEKSRRSSVIKAYITAGIRTLYLFNTSLGPSISCCCAVIRIKMTEEPQDQEKTESAEICSYSKTNKMHLLTAAVWHMPDAVCAVLSSWCWTERPSETCRVFHENKWLEKEVHLVGFTIGIYYDARTCERQSLKHNCA